MEENIFNSGEQLGNVNHCQIDIKEFVKKNGSVKELPSKVLPGKNETFVENSNDIQEDNHDEGNILTREEYEELCQRFANNEELTLEELKALRRSTPELMEESGPSLKINSGFINSSMAIYLLVVFAIISLIISSLFIIK